MVDLVNFLKAQDASEQKRVGRQLVPLYPYTQHADLKVYWMRWRLLLGTSQGMVAVVAEVGPLGQKMRKSIIDSSVAALISLPSR